MTPVTVLDEAYQRLYVDGHHELAERLQFVSDSIAGMVEMLEVAEESLALSAKAGRDAAHARGQICQHLARCGGAK